MTKYPIIYADGSLGEIDTLGEEHLILKTKNSDAEETFTAFESSYDITDWKVRVVFLVYVSDKFTPKSNDLVIGQRQKLIEGFIRDNGVYFASYGKRWRIP